MSVPKINWSLIKWAMFLLLILDTAIITCLEFWGGKGEKTLKALLDFFFFVKIESESKSVNSYFLLWKQSNSLNNNGIIIIFFTVTTEKYQLVYLTTVF